MIFLSLMINLWLTFYSTHRHLAVVLFFSSQLRINGKLNVNGFGSSWLGAEEKQQTCPPKALISGFEKIKDDCDSVRDSWICCLSFRSWTHDILLTEAADRIVFCVNSIFPSSIETVNYSQIIYKRLLSNFSTLRCNIFGKMFPKQFTIKEL